MTALFNQIIFGPVRSRRLGISLGVNLLPVDSKLCTFDCIYCECGWNAEHSLSRRFNRREDVRSRLAATLKDMRCGLSLPDVITFAGNGEPTMHPEFELIINDVLELRDRYAPTAKVSVLTNASMIDRPGVRRALLKVDNPILKLDSAIDATRNRINRPQQPRCTVEWVKERMKCFDGRFILQTMFLRGTCEGEPIDNTTETEVAAWLEAVREIHPRSVMVYSLDRDTPCKSLEKIPREELERIAARVAEVGFACSVA